jgi:hypothetical protein
VQPETEPLLGLQLIPGGLLVTVPAPCPTEYTLKAGRLLATIQPGVPAVHDVSVALPAIAVPLLALASAVIVV